MKKITIICLEYLEEQNTPWEAAICKKQGPMIPTGERDESGQTIRIPHTGFIHDNVEYILVGFGTLDKRVYTIPREIDQDVKKMLGNSQFFLYTNDLKERLSKALSTRSWKEIKAKAKSLKETGNYGPLQALQAALEDDPEPESIVGLDE